MKYFDKVTVTPTIFIKADNLPKLKPGDRFANSVYGVDKNNIIYDGGIDYRDRLFPVAHAREHGKFLILTNENKIFRYAYRPTKGA